MYGINRRSKEIKKTKINLNKIFKKIDIDINFIKCYNKVRRSEKEK